MQRPREITEYSMSVTKSLVPSEITPEAKEIIADVTSLLMTLKMERNLTWSAGVLNFSEALRGLDKAQAAILNKSSRAGSITALIKAGLSDGLGIGIPVLGSMIALAKMATPPVDKQIDALSAALGTLKALFVFKEIAELQNARCALALSIFDSAIAREKAALVEMKKILQPLS
jgi:hypothetical protein